jgi:hypothetical protein
VKFRFTRTGRFGSIAKVASSKSPIVHTLSTTPSATAGVVRRTSLRVKYGQYESALIRFHDRLAPGLKRLGGAAVGRAVAQHEAGAGELHRQGLHAGLVVIEAGT